MSVDLQVGLEHAVEVGDFEFAFFKHGFNFGV